LFADLADELDPRMPEQRFDPCLVIGAIDAIDLGPMINCSPTR
jgi:hypothetical protein